MITWNYRVFREEDGDYIIREVTYGDNGEIIGCTKDAMEPFGKSLEELAQDLDAFQEALQYPVLTLADVEAAIANQPSKAKQSRKTISHAELVKKLGLDVEAEYESNDVALVHTTT
ncbi:MAG: hypothetical protein KDE31_12605 [Caldilineaceae bacterium]|nr:hypothetical protein [Caldilineaceae bacterium]